MALTRSRASTAAAAPPALSPASVSIPIRFQCPLCLDVLRRPIQLPCCQRYLCMECFERGLELTSVNCGFCRRRVVGFARTKQYKVDAAMWTAIKTQCPFLGDVADDREPLVEFFDEDAPPPHNGSEDHPTAAPGGELKAFYERQLRQHQSQVHEAEQRALEQTIEFLQNDPEFTASLAASSSPASSTSSSSSNEVSLSSDTAQLGARKKSRVSATPMATRSSTQRPVTRSASNAVDEKQPKLDDFFGSSRATSSHAGHSGQSLRRAHSTSVGLSSPRAPTHLKIDEPHKKYFLRSASHSPTPTKQRRRQPIKNGRKNLLQLTLETTISPIALHTRSKDLKRASSVDSESEPSKMLTRQGRRRSSWKCSGCTYTNTCFDSRCSMCRSLPPPEAYASLSSQ
ncbi:e3 ubiquitin-protein ligase rnf168 [Phytophthora cinnamomi]|uniref:e3 ubiquitin-protein ligase rnf168 n=1 Tax=Phytophthora cinnamomi TaxID=4785 RepID=UPI003559FA52|nr:e3 ubiquitin-protein ligase rnf168 [Phytophthora cinnamomi]